MEDRIIQVFLDLIDMQKARIKELERHFTEAAAACSVLDHEQDAIGQDIAEAHARIQELEAENAVIRAGNADLQEQTKTLEASRDEHMRLNCEARNELSRMWRITPQREPEEALKAAGRRRTQPQGTAGAIGSTGRKEYCPATTDHYCPKAEACDGACLYDTAVKS